jgi:thiol-disulfide isomerase/thioredoxin
MPLLEFYGDTCPHCLTMKPIVAKVEKELGVEVEKYEVWNDEDNAKKMMEHDRGLCGGVPFFFNTESKHYICGSADAATLKAWAQGKKV